MTWIAYSADLRRDFSFFPMWESGSYVGSSCWSVSVLAFLNNSSVTLELFDDLCILWISKREDEGEREVGKQREMEMDARNWVFLFCSFLIFSFFWTYVALLKEGYLRLLLTLTLTNTLIRIAVFFFLLFFTCFFSFFFLPKIEF